MNFILIEMDILIPEFKRILLVLIKHEVRFMLIGGYAVIFHGYERSTSDLYQLQVLNSPKL